MHREASWPRRRRSLRATVRDCALAYAVMAGPDPADPNSLAQPAPVLDGLDQPDLSDVTLGICTPWFQDAEPGVVEACTAMLEELKRAGCRPSPFLQATTRTGCRWACR